MKKTFKEGGGELSIANKDGDVNSTLSEKEKLAGLIEAYKKQNPAKYEQKKTLLEEQLKKL